MAEENPLHLLSYATPSGSPESLWTLGWKSVSTRWRRIPLPVASVIISIPVCLILLCRFWREYRYGDYGDIRWTMPWTALLAMAPLFLPGAMRRGRGRDWRTALVFWVAAGVVEVAAQWFVPHGYHVFRWLGIEILVLFAMAMSEWLSLDTPARRSLAIFALSVIGATCAWSILDNWLQFSASLLAMQNWTEPWSNRVDLGLSTAIRAFVAWIAISWVMKPRAAEPRRRLALLGGASTAVAVYFFLFGPMFVPLAGRSVLGHGPFNRLVGAMIIDREGSASDLTYLYQALELSDRDRVTHCFGPPGWRDFSARVVIDRDPAAAAGRFSQSLLAHPNRELAEDCASLLAAQHRYETAPLLLRFAFRNVAIKTSVGWRCGYDQAARFGPPTDQCAAALESLNVPQVAQQIMTTEWTNQIESGRPTCVYDAAIRERLSRLLGSDAGGEPRDWEVLYERSIGSAPSPLSPELRREVEAVTEAIRRCRDASERLFLAGLSSSNPPAPPNFDVVTTREFLREVDAYVERVNQTIAAHATRR